MDPKIQIIEDLLQQLVSTVHWKKSLRYTTARYGVDNFLLLGPGVQLRGSVFESIRNLSFVIFK